MMLPNLLHSSYRTYKQDTDDVASWLAFEAKQRGYPADLLDQHSEKNEPGTSSKRLKGKARKQAKNATGPSSSASATPLSQGQPAKPARYKIKIQDFMTLASYVATSTKPVIKIPFEIVLALQRSIKLRRQRYSIITQGKGQSGRANPDSDERHLHFLGVLEQVQDILRPRMPSSIEPDPSSIFDHPPSAENPLSNKFVGLDVQEPTQAFLDAPDAPKESTGVMKSDVVYEAELEDDLEEEYLATHCLMEDVRQIRAFCTELWSNFKQGMDIAAVALTINTAITFVRDLEQDFLMRYPKKVNYEDIMKIFYGAQCLDKGQDPAARQRPGDIVNFSVYEEAESVMVPTYSTLCSLSDIVEPNVAPIYKPGHFGHRNLAVPWNAKSPREKIKDDQIVLFEAFSDLYLLASMMEKGTIAEDELIRGVRGMAPDKPVPMWLVFAMQCFLDAQHILHDDLDQPYHSLYQYANSTRASIEMNLKFHQSLKIENWPPAQDNVFHEYQRVMRDWIGTDIVGNRISKIASKLGASMPDPEPARLLKQYPLLCGLWLYSLKIRFQNLSVTFANAWGSIMYAGHIYNAVRQEKLLRRPWRDMEMAIALQSTETFFVGNRPEGADAYLKHFLLCMGYSATNLASNRRPQKAKASSRGPKDLKHLSKIAQTFAGRYVNNEASVSWTKETLQPIIDAKVDDDYTDGYGSQTTVGSNTVESLSAPARQQKGKGKAKPSPTGALLIKQERDTNRGIPIVDFLSDLANALHAETLELTLDYLLLHRFSWMLLRSINEECKPELLEIYGGGYLMKENQLPFVVGYIFMTATNTNRIGGEFVRKKEGVQVTSRLLQKAAAAIESMVSTSAGRMAITMLEKAGLPVDFRDMDEMEPDALI